MGTPLPPDPEGEHCEFCFGPDGPHSAYETPLYVYVEFDGLQPEPGREVAYNKHLTKPIQLTQRPGYPCEYVATLDGINCHLRWGSTGPQFLTVGFTTSLGYFFGSASSDCQTEFSNEHEQGTGQYGFGGTAKVTWGT